MAFFSFGKRIKPRKFDYLPVYYDQEKEERENRNKVYGSTSTTDSDVAKKRISYGFKSKYRGGNSSVIKSSRRMASLRLVIIIGLLLLITYYVIESDAFLDFLNWIYPVGESDL